MKRRAGGLSGPEALEILGGFETIRPKDSLGNRIGLEVGVVKVFVARSFEAALEEEYIKIGMVISSGLTPQKMSCVRGVWSLCSLNKGGTTE